MNDKMTTKLVKLSKEQELRILEFFVKTSIPRMLQSIKESE